MDRISQLPDSIVHHILSLLNGLQTRPAKLVRLSILSKRWFDIITSFPVLDFYIYNFRPTKQECYFKYVKHTTSKFCHHSVAAYMLRLIATIQKPAELNMVNKCLESVLKKSVRELVIDIRNLLDTRTSNYRYRLPSILLSVSMLKSLTIRGCELPYSLMFDSVKFKSLIHLELKKINVYDKLIKYLTTSCHLLQVFHIKSCYGLKRFG
ncbi:putative F-box domain, leucine-rich repeat domain superfamily, F-box-like domain superfamily [Helianthus annuus]|nr:putative F-box domain, leucine-rich repeat domain superfamily, F-box-like domain superfamily [Helianthus annuus]